jgi:hypothetical protein
VDGFAALAPSVQQLFVNDLKLDNRREHAPVLATEFVGTSITSGAGKYGAFARHLPESRERLRTTAPSPSPRSRKAWTRQ